MSNLQIKNATLITPAVFEPGGRQPSRPAHSLRPWHYLLGLMLCLLLAILAFLLSATSLELRVTPVNSQIQLDGPYHIELGERTLLMPGQYQLQITHPGYQPHQQVLDTSSSDDFSLDIHLAPQPGRLQLATNVPAQVFIDGQAVGNSQQDITNLPLGQHQLQVTAERYLPYEQPIEIVGFGKLQTLSVELKPAWGTLQLDSYPSGATLSVNDVPQGQTPLQLELMAGEHRLQLSHPGYQSWQQRLQIEPGQNLSIEQARLLPASATLNLSSKPVGASVTLDGLYQGKTPVVLSLEANKTHQLQLLLEGYQPLDREVQAPSGAKQALDLPLTALLGKVAISSEHQDALLYVNDILMGRANQTLELATRPQRVRITLDGYADFTRELTPRAGQLIRLQAKLKTLEQARFDALPKQLQILGDARLHLFHPQVSFQMGASRREQGRRANETMHNVKLSRPFYLGATEVTNRQYRQFESFHSSSHAEGASLDGENQPAVNVSWLNAARFCNWLSAQQGLAPFYLIEDNQYQGFDATSNGYRLPSEAEWAWAARYQNAAMQQFSWGQQLPPPPASANLAGLESAALVGDVLANFEDKFRVSAPVGSFAANDKGLYDLMGNVSEWVHDVYQIHSGLNFKAEQDPLGSQQGIHHVIRGASWAHARLTELRLSYRDYGSEPRRDLGFRLARYAEPLSNVKETTP
ncbi:PEGA domain-containing protein [Bowmanella denitrificans]